MQSTTPHHPVPRDQGRRMVRGRGRVQKSVLGLPSSIRDPGSSLKGKSRGRPYRSAPQQIQAASELRLTPTLCFLRH